MGPLLHTAPAWCINANDLGLEASYECGDVSAMRLTDLSDGLGLVCWLSDGVGGPHPFSLALSCSSAQRRNDIAFRQANPSLHAILRRVISSLPG